MKKLLLSILILLSLSATCQIRFLMPIVTASGGGGTPTTFWFNGFQNEFQTTGPTSPIKFKYIYGTNTNISTAGNVSFSGIQPDGATTPTIGFVNGTGLTNYSDVRTPLEAGTGAANSGLFANDEIIGFGWQFNNGATFTFSGLTVGQTYWLYILFNANSWESANCSFTVAGQTSNVINDGDNFGSSTTSPWYTSSALASKQFTCTSTSQTVTLNASTINVSWGVMVAAVLGK